MRTGPYDLRVQGPYGVSRSAGGGPERRRAAPLRQGVRGTTARRGEVNGAP
ncbi:hypothetical protein TPA0909_56150 [Streptomyces albus]|nr:hypothetical protein TPA0909_56150 [Streptomyces albus]